MTDRLPPNLLALFQPRPPLRYLPPHDFAPEERRTKAIDGVAAFLPALAEKVETSKNDPISESWLERKDRIRLEKAAKQKYITGDGVEELYKPKEDENIRGDPFRTIFVGRLPYSCTTKDLEHEFERFGPIERVRIVTDRNPESKRKGKSKGYGFVLFEREGDVNVAYKATRNAVIRGRPITVDVERGRTTPGWRPRRFGGGLGGRNYTKETRSSGYGAPAGPGFRGSRDGGFRGGFGDRGGFRGGRGGGGFRGGGGGYGGRGGIGYQNGAPPDGAPAGPRGGGGGGYGGDRRGYGGGGYGDRDGGRSNANFEPLPPRGGGGFRDRDRDRDRDRGGDRDRDRDSYNPGQKRPYDGGGGGYDDSRQRRRY